MFSSGWKEQIVDSLRDLENQIGEIRKNEGDLKGQIARLQLQMRNLGKKLALRMPVSIESLEKGLPYDLLFSDEIDLWLQASKGLIIDLRSALDFQMGTIPGALNYSYDALPQKVESLSRETPVLLVCDTGIKSVSAADMLMTKGFSYLYVLKGGFSLYKQATVKTQPAVMH